MRADILLSQTNLLKILVEVETTNLEEIYVSKVLRTVTKVPGVKDESGKTLLLIPRVIVRDGNVRQGPSPV